MGLLDKIKEDLEKVSSNNSLLEPNQVTNSGQSIDEKNGEKFETINSILERYQITILEFFNKDEEIVLFESKNSHNNFFSGVFSKGDDLDIILTNKRFIVGNGVKILFEEPFFSITSKYILNDQDKKFNILSIHRSLGCNIPIGGITLSTKVFEGLKNSLHISISNYNSDPKLRYPNIIDASERIKFFSPISDKNYSCNIFEKEIELPCEIVITDSKIIINNFKDECYYKLSKSIYKSTTRIIEKSKYGFPCIIFMDRDFNGGNIGYIHLILKNDPDNIVINFFEESMSKSLSESIADSELNYQNGLKKFHEGNYKIALDIFSVAANIDYKNHKARNAAGISLFNLGISTLNLSVSNIKRKEKDVAVSNFGCAVSYFKTSVTWFEMGLKIDPGNVTYQNNLDKTKNILDKCVFDDAPYVAEKITQEIIIDENEMKIINSCNPESNGIDTITSNKIIGSFNNNPTMSNNSMLNNKSTHSSSEKTLIFKMEGIGEILEVYDDYITITPVGVIGLLCKGLKGTKSIPITSITAIQFKTAGFTAGYLQFTIPGGNENRGGVLSAGTDENTFMFAGGVGSNELASEIKEFIDEKARNVNKPISGKQPLNLSEELEKLVALKSKGYLSDEEFINAKTRIFKE